MNHPKRSIGTVVMAAGKGVRMRSPVTKMLMPILGRAVFQFPVERALALSDGPVVVVAGDALQEMQKLLPATERLRYALQPQPLGTADAVKCGLAALPDCDEVLILNGDVPCVSDALLGRLVEKHLSRSSEVSFIAFEPPDPTGYGRVISCEGVAVGIKEEKELEPDERSLRVVNAGLYLVRATTLAEFLDVNRPSAKQKEYLLTDVVSFVADRHGITEVLLAEDPGEVAGINNRAELADVTERIRSQRNRSLMVSGVGMPQPGTVDVDFSAEVGHDTVLEPGVSLRGKTRIGAHCTVGQGTVVVDCTIGDNVEVLPYCVLESSIIEDGCGVGPFAHTRTGTVLKAGAKMGNFVETKKTVLGPGSKANHLSYLGDATIGSGVNVGAGTITCNYDGYKKYPTRIDDGAFIGSDTQLVAPVTVGKDAVVAAGTTVTRDVPPGALALSRVEQVHRDGYAAKKRGRMKKD